VNKRSQNKCSASTTSSLSFPHPSSSSDPGETPHLPYDEIGGFISLLPVFAMGVIGLFFPPARRPLLLLSFSCTLCFSQTDLRHVRFLHALLGCTPVFFSNSAFYGQMVLIYAEPGPEDLALPVPFFLKLKAVDSELEP
jgi:hypothetical protein